MEFSLHPVQISGFKPALIVGVLKTKAQRCLYLIQSHFGLENTDL